jgi:hypothetical protein
MGRADAARAEAAAVSVASLLGEEDWASDEGAGAEEEARAQWECMAHCDFSADAVLLDKRGAATRVAVLSDALTYLPAPSPASASAAMMDQRQLAERRLVGRLGRVLYELFTGRAYRPPQPQQQQQSQQQSPSQQQRQEAGFSTPVGTPPRSGGQEGGGGGGGEGEENEGEYMDEEEEEEEEEEEDEGYLRELPELGSLVHALLSQQQQPPHSPPPFFPLRRALQALARVAQRRCAKVALERVEKSVPAPGACMSMDGWMDGWTDGWMDGWMDG